MKMLFQNNHMVQLILAEILTFKEVTYSVLSQFSFQSTMNGMCRKLFLLTFAFNKISCDDFYNLMKSNPDLTTSLYDQYDFGDLKDYEDLLEEESKDNEIVEEENFVESRERAEDRSYQKHSSGCSIKYETVSVVKQVPSFSKHCHKVEDTKCKTVYKNAVETKMETQCVAAFDTR